MKMKLGEMLLWAKVVSDRQIQSALAEQGKWGGKLGHILVRMGYLSEDLLVKALSKQLGVPRVDLEKSQPSPHALRKVKADLAEEYAVLPIELRDNGATLVVAMSDPQNVRILDDLRAASGCRSIVAYLAGEQEIRRHVGRHYGSTDVGQGSGSDDFKIIDSQGKTVIKSIGEVEAEAAAARARRRPMSAVASEPLPEPTSKDDPVALLKRVEQVQRKEIQALKAIVELLIEKGVFSRDEYLSKVGRR